MSQHGKNPVGLWKVINGLARARQPQSRDQRRCLCLRFWGAVRELLRFKVLYRHGPLIALQDFATRPRSPKRRAPSVGTSTSKMTGSNPVVFPAGTPANNPQTTDHELVISDANTVGSVPETKSATPTPAEVSAAASALARLPRRPKRIWSGWLNDRVRTYRNMPIKLAGGETVYAFGARRRLLVYVREPGMCVGDPDEVVRSWGVVRASEVEVVRNPHAALLGRLKAGTRERKSEAKARAARLNGLRPCRKGKRRGRPSSRNQYPLRV